MRVACAATFNNCTFTNNTATAGNAGAIWVTDTGTLTAIGCLFQDNSTSAASKCGGAVFNYKGAVRLTDCTFIDNMASGSGGYGGAITSFNGSVFVDRCYFRASKGLVKIGGHHIDMRSGTLGVNNCVFTGPFGQGVNQINNAGESPQPMYIANTVFNSQQSAALIANAGAGVIVNSIMINSASSGNGLSVSNTGTLNLHYTLYNKAEEGEGKVAPVVTSCVAGILGNTGGTAFPTWYKTNSSTMNSNDQTSTSTVSDARGSVHYYVWNGTIPSGLGTITMPSITEVKAALGSSAFLTWLGDANLSVDIRGMARDTDAMWPGSYQGTGTKVNWLLVALAAAVSCGKENPAGEAEPAGNRLVELHASLGEDTRASVNGTGTVSWEASDEISVWTSADTKKTFSMVSISGGYASFQAYLNVGETPQTLAVFPVRSFGTVSGRTVTIVYPYTYTYREGAMEAPMAALIEGETIAFRHLGGVVRVQCDDVPESASKFNLVANGQQIVGSFTVSVGAGMSVETIDNASYTKAIVNFTANTGAKTFNVPIPAGHYRSIYAYFSDSSDNKIKEWQVMSDVTVARGDMFVRPMPEDMLRVMSFNIRFAHDEEEYSAGDGRLWSERKLVVPGALGRRYMPQWVSQIMTRLSANWAIPPHMRLRRYTIEHRQ